MKRNEAFLLREVAGEAMLIPSGKDTGINGLVALNAVGADIWKMLGENCDRDYVLAEMVKKYEADEETIAKDLDAFLYTLKEKKILLD